MQMPKAKIIEYFIVGDDLDRAAQADASLPTTVDLEADAEALRALGMDPGLLATQIANLEPTRLDP